MVGSIERSVTLELNSSGVQARIPVRQGDSLIYKVRIKLTCGGRAFSPKGVALAQVYAMLPDGSIVTADCMENRGGGYVFVPGTGFFKLGGPVLCRLILRGDDGGEMYSSAFAFDAETCFSADREPVPAEEYSRLEELLLRVLEVKMECEKIASEFGKITATGNSISKRDSIIVYNVSKGEYVKVNWEYVSSAMKDIVSKDMFAVGLTDPEETGYIATLPELEEDSIIALASQIPTKPGDIGAQPAGNYVPAGQTVTVTGIDENGVTHTWKMYGVKV